MQHGVCVCVLSLNSVLLKALLKNGSAAANGGTHYRKSANGAETTATPSPQQTQETNTDMTKGFTKEQVDGVQRSDIN